MNRSLISAVVSMQAIQQKLDVLSHNIANVNTTGYKRRDASFQDILTNVQRQPQSFAREGRLTPLGLTQGWGMKIGQIEINMDQGALHPTGNPLDVAIEGGGVFEIFQDTVDNDGNPTIAWTRDGSFQLTHNPAYPGVLLLATSQGELVRGTTNEPIQIPPNHSIQIDEDGRIFATNNTNPEAEPLLVDELKIMRVLRPNVLLNDGNNTFTLPPGMALDGVMEQVDPLTNNINEQTKVSVRQGFIEQSNVNLTDEMTELMTVQRAYQLNARAITSSDTLMSLTNNLRA